MALLCNILRSVCTRKRNRSTPDTTSGYSTKLHAGEDAEQVQMKCNSSTDSLRNGKQFELLQDRYVTLSSQVEAVSRSVLPQLLIGAW